MVEQLEQRVLLTATVNLPTWIEMVQGPITGSATGAHIGTDNPAAGAVDSLATPPNNADIVYAGSVNGGVWRSVDATAPSPTWTPLTDAMPSLSIGSIALSHFDADGNLITSSTPTSLPYSKLVIYAGTGRYSSGANLGGSLTGLMISQDGGDHWTPIGGDTFKNLDIESIVPSLSDANTILVAAQSPNPNNLSSGAGIWIGNKNGTDFKFTQVLAKEPSDLVGDPGNANRFYAAVPHVGIFTTTTASDKNSWLQINNGLQNLATTGRMRMSVFNNGATANVVYAALIGDNAHTKGIYSSLDHGNTWTLIPGSPDVNGGAQGLDHFSIAADPSNSNVVFVGGDSDFGNSPAVYRADVTAGSVWDLAYTLPNSPHPDSRAMVFNAAGDLLESDDGGVYRLTSPDNATTRTWDSRNGNLHVGEFWSAAYDSANRLLFGGLQDIGFANQHADFSWEGLPSGDGTIVQVDNSVAGQSTHYLSDNNLSTFIKQTFDSSGNNLGGGDVPVAINGAAGYSLNGNNNTKAFEIRKKRPFLTQYAIEHDKDSGGNDRVRMLIGTGFLYESFDGGQTLIPLSGLNAAGTGPNGNSLGDVVAMAYGGSFNGVAAPDVAYVAATKLWVRTSIATPNSPKMSDFQVRQNYPGGQIKDLVLDPTDWHKGYVVDANGVVWKFVNTGSAASDWTNITGNLSRYTKNLFSIDVMSGANVPGGLGLLMGGRAGVYVTFNPSSSSSWAKIGKGMPNLYVTDVRYEQSSDTLTAASMGRGAWEISHFLANLFSTPSQPLASSAPLGAPPAQASDMGVLTITGDGLADKNDTFRLVLDAANPDLLDVFVDNTTQTPDLTVDAASIQRVVVTGGTGTNTLILDHANGLVSFADGITLDASTTRQDINETPVDSGIVSDIRSGLQAVADWSKKLAQLGQLAQTIPGLGTSLSQTLAIGDGSDPISGILQQGLVAKINSYFTNDASPTIQELTDFLKSISQPMGKVSFGIDPASISGGLYPNSEGSQDLRFDLAIHLSGLAADLPLNFSSQLSSLGIGFDSTGQLQLRTALDLDLSFGVDLTPGLSNSNAFFIKVNDLSASAEVSAGSPSSENTASKNDNGEDADSGVDPGGARDGSINANLHVGFLTASVVDGAIDLNAAVQLKVNNPDGDPDGHITMAELTGTPIGALVSLSAKGSLDATLPVQINLAGFTVPAQPEIDINDDDLFGSLPEVTTKNFDQLLNFDNGAALLSLGIGQLITFLSTTAKNSAVFQKKIPLVNKSLNDVMDFTSFFQGLSNATAQVPNASGILQSPFQDSDALLTLLQGLTGSTASVKASGEQIIYTLHLHGTDSTNVPLSLDLGSALHLGVNAQLAFNVGIDANVSFGIDGSTQQFFIVSDGQPAIQLTANLAATVNGGASLGFLNVSINNGSVTGTGSGSLTLVDPQTDSPATPGIITGSELAASSLSSLVSIGFSGSAAATVPLSTTVPGISPVTLAISFPDLTDPSNVSFDTSGLDQFMGFNGLTFDSVLGYLKQLPTLLGHISDSGVLGKAIGFLGSSVGDAAKIGDKLQTYIAPLENANIHSIQDLQTFLTQELVGAGQSLLLNVTTSDIDFKLAFTDSYSGSSAWSLGQTIGGGLLSLQTSGTLPLTASFSAGLEFGISLTPQPNPLDQFYIVEGPNSKVSGSFSVNATGLTATATVGYLATVGVQNGTASVNGSVALPLGGGAAGTHLTLSQLLADPSQLFAAPQISGSAHVVLPLTGLPGQTGTPQVVLDWTNVSDPQTLSVDTSTINFSNLNPLANFDASSVLSSINSLLTLIQQWGGSSIMKTNIPLINKPISDVLDYVNEAQRIFQQIQQIGASDPSAFDAAVQAAPQAAGFLSSQVQIATGSLNNPGAQSFDYILQFHHTINDSIPFQFGPGFFSINGNVNVGVTFATNLEFGYDPADGFYIVGDPNTPAISLSANITGVFDRIGGMFGPISYGISNGTANAAVGLALDLVPPGDNGRKISGSELAQNISGILKPSITGSANLNLPLGFTIGSGGPGVTTSFSASWDPSRAQPFEFGANNSTDIADGFGPVNYDLGEVINNIVGPVLSDIESHNPIPQSVLDVLNEKIPVIDKTPAELLGDYLNNPGFKLLLGIESAIGDMPTSGADFVDLTNYYPAGQMPSGGDTGGPQGGVPPSGNPNGTPTSGNFGAFKSFQQTLENDFYLKLPILDSLSTSIINILTGKPVTLIKFDPGKVSLSASYVTPTISFPLLDFGFADVSATLSANIGASIFADIDIELTTRGLQGTYISDGKLKTGQSANILDGLAIDDSDQYQAGVTLSGGVTIGGSVDILGYSAASLSGSLTLTGILGAHVNDLSYLPDGTIQGPANYQGNGPGDKAVYLDEVQYLDNNYGLACTIMPAGELDATVSLSVSALGGLFSKQLASGTVTLANYNGPCASTLADLANVQGTSLVMHPNASTSGLRVNASIVDNSTTGQPQYLRITTNNDDVNDYQLFALSDLTAAGVNTLVLEGTNGDDEFFIDPTVTKAGGMHFLRINTGDGNDRVNLASLTAANSTITGETITAGNGNDSITGNYAPEVITLGSGTDQVAAGTGNDSITCGSGNETITASNGNDTVVAGSGADLIGLGDGNNTVIAGSGNATISVGNGKNLIQAGSGTETINTGDGDNKIFASTTSSKITLGAGENIVYGTSGNTTITGGGGNNFISLGGGTNTVDGGGGRTTLAIVANADQTLSDGLVNLGATGTITFTNVASISLTGGAGNNTFDISGWTGSPVQINGGGGSDTVVSSNNTDFTITDTSLARTNGTKFALNGIGSARLTSGAADASFDVTGWHGNATLTGGGGLDTVVAGNLKNATLTDTTLQRAGAASIALVNVRRAVLTTILSGSAQINASAFSGTVALYGQGNGNTLTGGTGSDYLFGGSGSSNVLTGNGALDNQIIGGTGSSNTIQGGPGSNLLVGSSGGSDTITVGSGPNHVYTPGGNDTVNAQAGNAIVYLTGSGNVVQTGSSTTDKVVHPGDPGTNPSDFVAPTPNLGDLPQPSSTTGLTLPSGSASQGQWVEYAGSASNGGLSNSSGSAIEPSIVATGTGASAAEFVAWSDNRSGVYEIYVARYSNGAWQELADSAEREGISNTLIDSRRPSVTLDSSGNPVVAWTEINGTSTDIFAAKFDPTANGGAGAWVALGSSLSADGLSNTGHADSAQIVNTSAGPVVAWLDTSSGHANVFVRQFDGTSWVALGSGSDSGTGISASSTNIPGFALATSGTNTAIAWTQPGTSAGNSIYLKQYNGSAWAAVGSSDSGTGISGSSSSNSPSLAYQGSAIYAAWAAIVGGTSNIAVATSTGSTWTPVAIDTPASAGANQISRGAASHPTLTANGGSLDLIWLEDRFTSTTNQAVAIYANRLSGGSFVRQLPGDARFDGVLRRSTSLSAPARLALAVDGAGHPFVAWGDTSSGSSQVYFLGDTLDVHKIIYVNDALTANDSYTTAAGAASNNGLTPATPLDSIQAALNLSMTPGTVILVDSGVQDGFEATSTDNGVILMGAPGAATVISSDATITNASNITLDGLQVDGAITVNGGSNIELVNNTGGSLTDVLNGAGGTITLQSTSNVLVEHNSVAGLTLKVTTSGITIRDNQITGAGIVIADGTSGLMITGNTLRSVSVNDASQGTITSNNIDGGGMLLNATFTGSIDHNLIQGGGYGVALFASAPLNSNRIFNNTIGIVDSVKSSTTGLGFLAGAMPNIIIGNGTGVQLNGLMQGQIITSNGVGVTGDGVLGGTSLDSANLIVNNSTGVSFSGEVRFNRIGRNQHSLILQDGQLVDHNVFFDNNVANLETLGTHGGQIIDNTFFSTSQNNVLVDGGSNDIQVLNNVMWAKAGYDLDVADNSRSGFFSDYNDLYSTGSGKLVHYLVDFTDILDWQDAFSKFDLHSIGTTVVNPTGAQPRFVDTSLGDFRVFSAVAGLRPTSPIIATGDPALDLALPSSYQNLLTNPSFESGVTGWSVNVGGATQSSNPVAFDGSKYFYSGAVASGFAQQTISLSGTTNMDLIFGGRIRSAAENPADQGTLIVTFLDGSNNPIGSPTTLTATNTNDRWELVSSRVHIPAGAAKVTYRFQNLRQTGTTDDSYLDHAFVYMVPNTQATDMGAYGNTPASVSAPTDQSIHLQSPDLYVNWTLNQPHQILWFTFGNSGSGPVNIDLYQDVGGVPTFLMTIASSVADTGAFTWIPANSGLSANTLGLRIQISLVSNSAISDRSSETFAIPPSGTNFYTNDSSTSGDQYTTAVGSNRNTGMTPNSPLPMLTTLMREYSLSSSNTIFIDNGSYNTFAPAVFSSLSTIGTGAGATIHGPTANGTAATITALGYTNDAIIDVNDANFVTITNLSLVGGEYGIWALAGSQNLTLSSISATRTTAGGIRIESNSTGAALDHITASNNTGDGIFVGGSATTLDTITADNNSADGVFIGGAFTSLNNAIADHNASDGFDLINSGSATVTRSEASGNRIGLYSDNTVAGTTTMIGSSNLSAGLGNIFHNNSAIGIDIAFGTAAVYGNTVYGQPTGDGFSTGIGISVGGNNPVSYNVVWGNFVGLYVSEDSTPVTYNRVYDNTSSGITLTGFGGAVGNDIYSNGVGIQMNSEFGSTAVVQNNLIYSNATGGIVVNSSTGVSLTNNTIYQTTGDAVKVTSQSTGTSLRDNILWDTAGGGYDIDVASNSEQGFAADYNLLYTSGSGVLGLWGGISTPTLASWQAITASDANSLVAAPLFVNMAGADGVLGFSGGVDHGTDDDFHDKSTGGSFHGGSLAPAGSTALPTALTPTLTNDASTSPAVDRGDPAASFANEPAPNGGFINIGAYGNTTQASVSPIPYVVVLAPNGGESAFIGQNLTVRWRSEDSGSSIDIDLMQGASPATATLVSNIATGVANNGQYVWSVPSTGITPASNYYIRVTREASSPNPAVSAISASAFTINGSVTAFYVNDNMLDASGDITTAVGNDANDGLTPATPKASIQALLQAYTLGAGDTIFVDAGTYNIAGNIILKAANSGVTIEGYSNASFPTYASVINRGNTAAGSYAFDLQGASNVTFDHLSITGADVGIHASDGAGSTGLTITNNQIYNNPDDEIYLGSGNGAAVISGNTIYGQSVQSSADAGILINADAVTISNNIVHDNFYAGIHVQGNSSGTISGNTVYNNDYGIEANNVSVTGNIAYNNINDGILGTGTAVVTGNTAHDNTASFFGLHTGIELDNGASGSGNVVYNNKNGIYVVGSNVLAKNNLAYGNSSAGIEVNGTSDLVSGNVMYSNGWGIHLSNATTITINNNLIYNNSTGGIDFQTGQLSPAIINNTIYQPAGDGIRIEQYATNSGGTTFPIRNNIIWTQNGYDLNLDPSVDPALASDYNDLYITGNGQIGKWQSAGQATLFNWQTVSQNDAESISADPLFVNAAGGDFHEQSTHGSFHGGSLAPVLNGTTGLPQTVATPSPTNDAANSPAIDRGAAGDAFNLEPTPNGGFINLGAFGDTAQASISPPAYVLLIHPNGGDNWATKQTFNILWHDDQIARSGTQTVTIDLIEGNTTTNIVTGLTDTGTYAWHIPSTIAAATDYRIRVTETGSASSSDTSDSTFSIVQTAGIYYVNDGSVSPGDLTTAPGNDANDGLTPATPKASIQSVLNSYVLNPGDTIKVDVGGYSVSSNILLTAADNGIIITGPGSTTSTARYVTAVQGDSPADYFQLNETSGTVATDSSGHGNNATYIGSPSLGQGTSFGAVAPNAVGLNGSTQAIQFSGGLNNLSGGFTFEAWVNPVSTNATECIFDVGNGSTDEISLIKTVFTNNLLISDSHGSFQVSGGLLYNTWQYLALTISSTGAATLYRNGAAIGSGTLSAPTNSTRSVNMLGTSVPYPPYYFAAQMQQAAFYTTALSPTQVSNHYAADGLAVLNRGNSSGLVFQLDGASNVTIQGLVLTGAGSGLGITSGVDSTNDTLTNCVVYSNSGAGVSLPGFHTADNFTLSNNYILSNGGYGALITNNNVPLITGNTIQSNGSGGLDMFTYGGTATGNTIQYNAGNGIDSGTNDVSIAMTISGNTITSNGGSGISNGHVNAVISNNVISGQTNAGQYGIVNYGHIVNNTVFNNYEGMYANGPSSFAQGNKVYDNSTVGIFFANGAYISGNSIYSNGTYGLSGGNNGGIVTTIVNNLIYSNTLGAFYSSAPAYISLLSNTIYQPTGAGIIATNNATLGAAAALIVRDNVLEVTAGPAYSLDDYMFGGTLADYNDVYVTGTGYIASVAGHAINSTATWVADSNNDSHSIFADPQFVNPAGADGVLGYAGGVDRGGDDNFHVQSTSPTIDEGDPAAAYSNEPAPNGSRLNLGYDGNTSAAAVSPAAQGIQVVYPSAGGEKLSAGSTTTISWVNNNAGSSTPDTTYANATEALSPSAYYRFDETSGTNAIDSSGHNFSGTFTGGVTLNQTGFLGAGYDSAVSFNGTNGYVQLPSGFASFPNGLSFAAWVYPTSTGSWSRFFDLGRGQASDNILFARNGTTNNLTFQVYTGPNAGATVSANNALVLNQWQQIAVTMTAAGAVTIYRNGVSVATGNVSVPVNVTRTSNFIARSNWSSDAYYAGKIDEAAFFNSVLTPQQIAAPYNAIPGTVHIDLTNSAGTTLQSIATNVPNNGSYSWSIPAGLAAGKYRVRVTSDFNGQWTDLSDNPFTVAPTGNAYYVNGASSAGYYTTAGGNDANDGKSPATPMATIQAVLNAYQPGAGATIYVDGGTYNLISTINLGSANSGLTIEGTPSLTTVLNRGNGSFGDYVFNLAGASNVTLDHMAITGGYAGINGVYQTTNTNVTISNNLIYGNYQYEISTNNQTNWNITGNTIHDTVASGGIGLYMPNTGFMTFSNNTVFNNSGQGFFVQTLNGEPNTISNNTAYANGTGIYGTGPITISGNTVYSNATYGIDAESGALVVGNNIYKQTATNAAGIYLLNNVEVRSNLIYDNYYGISSSQNSAIIDRNKIYSNTNAGITLSSYGIPQILENLIYSNAGPAISLNTIFNPGLGIIGNTIYQINADAVKMVSAPGVLVRNNILWTQNGYDLELDSASQTNFTSDYNDLNTGGSAKVGFWGGASQTTLANWQSASAKDAHSVSADPKFVDLDGADNVLGYSTAGNGSNDGGDDNFYLSAGSPAIDSGYSWASNATDLEGVTRSDDPGITNTGSNEYVPAVQSSSLFTAGGIAQNWNGGSAASWTLNLPFTFSYYGANYTSVFVGASGLLQFGGTSAFSQAHSDANLISNRVIAPLWDALQTNQAGNNIYVTSSSTQVTIRWSANKVSNQAAVNFAVTLFANGQIEFDYGSGNSGITPTVGISAGDGQHYQIVPGYDGQTTLTTANSVVFNQAPGIVDIGAYEFHGNSTSSTPPTVTGTTPSAVDAGSTTGAISQITLTFSEPLNAVDASSASSYTLVGAGADGIFGTSDDMTYALTPQYTAGSTQVTLVNPGGALPGGLYRLTALASATGGIHDVNGLLLDGDNNGTAGGNYVRTFTIATDTTPPTVADKKFDPNLPQQAITIRFSEDVSASLGTADLVLTNNNTSQQVPTGSTLLNYNHATNTATFTFPGFGGGILPDGNYTARFLASGITDAAGNHLQNDEVFNFLFMQADANQDGVVNALDFNALATNFGNSGTFTQGDFNHDGVVNSSDFIILAQRFNQQLPQPALPLDAIPLLSSTDFKASFASAPISGTAANQSRTYSLFSDVLATGDKND